MYPIRPDYRKPVRPSALKEAAFRQILTRTAQERGWPLTLRNKKGRLAYLRGINASGLPIYVTTTDNIISAATIGTNKIWPGGTAGLTLNGSTAALKGKIAVWDEGGQDYPRRTHRPGRTEGPSGYPERPLHARDGDDDRCRRESAG
ncbi:hypothetical protein ACQ86N_48330 [Puia sp. P3]|uniref:hypothetical protein n=1 Tax=Puia sp. P3 TaxID=3423952 RepID=UPI003D66EB86